MKQNFSSIDFQKVFNTFDGKIFNVHFNKLGNITLDVLDEGLKSGVHRVWPRNMSQWNKVNYTFYNKDGKIFIRAIKEDNYCRYPYLLNMTASSREEGRNYDTFENIDDAIVYFIEYLNIYHNIINF